MFRKAKSQAKRLTASEVIENARRLINNAIDEAEKAAGPGPLTKLLSDMLEARKYCAVVNQPGAHVFKVSAPPSSGPVERLMEILRRA